MASNVEKDTVSGQETTGHEWDGIRELNTPLPKWWVWVFYITVVWALGYWVLYPALPIGDTGTAGVLGYSSRANLNEEMDKAQAAKGEWLTQFQEMDVASLAADNDLRQYAMAGGQIAFMENCAACHQAGGAGAFGYPNLADDAWLWGGTLEEIEQTLHFGIRSGHDEARISEMPAFGELGILDQGQIANVAEYVLSLSGSDHDAQAAAAGQEDYDINCASCHLPDGAGMTALGSPALNDQIWLYGGTKQDLVNQMNNPQHGVMPAFGTRLDDATIKQLSIYVHSLGGGQ